jgi:gliding motility-associated-like protein
MFKHLLVISLLLKWVDVNAQIPNWQWAASAASSGNELAWDIAIDNFYSSSYVVGTFNGNLSAAFGSLFTSSYGGKDGFVAKYNQSGNVVWSFKIGGTNDDEAKSVAVDPAGNVYVAGCFMGACDFDPSAANYSLTPVGTHECFLAKYNSSGAFQWAVRFGSANTEDVWKVYADNNGVYVTGEYKTSISFYSTNSTTKTTVANDNDNEFFGAKYDFSGVIQWVVSGASNKDDEGYNVTADNNNVYFLGEFSHDLVFYDASSTFTTMIQDQGGNKPNVMVIAVSQNGNYVWHTNVVSNEDVVGRGLGQDRNTIYITGSIKATANFRYPSPQFTKTIAGATDIFVAAISKTSGDFKWVSSQTGSGAGEECGYGIKPDARGNLVAAFNFKNNLNYSAFGGPNLTSSGLEDVAVITYDTLGNFLWAKQITGNGKDVPHGLAVSPTGGIYIAGEYENPLGLDVFTLISGNGTNIFAAKTGCDIPINNLVSPSQNICIGNTPSTIVGSAALGSYGYVWKMSANSSTWTTATGTYTDQNYNPPILFNSMFYEREAIGTCTNVSTSSISIVYVDQYPTVAVAGANQTVCVTQCSLNANAAQIGYGSWSVISGSSSVNPPANNNSIASFLTPGANIFKWTISNGACPASSSTVMVFAETPVPAIAGINRQLCEQDSCHMRASNALGFGAWSLLSGNGLCSSATDPNSIVSQLNYGKNIFLWTVSKPNCPVLSDTIIVERQQAPSPAFAGEDQVIERSETEIAAQLPAVGQGSWTVVEGPGEIADKWSATTTIKKLAFGNNRFVWSVHNGICPSQTDEMLVYVKPLSVPNGFSPNLDGINDEFRITSLDYFTNVRFSVFNRWGSLVYKDENYKNAWEGTNMQGQKLVDDTYYYVLEIPDQESRTGFIVIKQNK